MVGDEVRRTRKPWARNRECSCLEPEDAEVLARIDLDLQPQRLLRRDLRLETIDRGVTDPASLELGLPEHGIEFCNCATPRARDRDARAAPSWSRRSARTRFARGRRRRNIAAAPGESTCGWGGPPRRATTRGGPVWGRTTPTG